MRINWSDGLTDKAKEEESNIHEFYDEGEGDAAMKYLQTSAFTLIYVRVAAPFRGIAINAPFVS